MTQSAFRSATKKWLICLIAAVLSPLPMFGLLMLAGQCTNGLGQCFGVSLLFLFWVGPIGAVAFSLLLLWSIGRRVQSLRMGVMWTVAVTVWLFALAPQAALAVGLGGLSIFTMFGSAAGLRRVAEILIALPRTPFPFLLALVVFLCRAEPGDILIADPKRRAAMIAAAVSAGYVTILFLGQALGAISRIPFFDFRAALRPVASMAWKLHMVATFAAPYWLVPLFYWAAFAIFSGALAYLITTQEDDGASRRGGAAGIGIATRPGAPSASFGKRRERRYPTCPNTAFATASG